MGSSNKPSPSPTTTAPSKPDAKKSIWDQKKQVREKNKPIKPKSTAPVNKNKQPQPVKQNKYNPPKSASAMQPAPARKRSGYQAKRVPVKFDPNAVDMTRQPRNESQQEAFPSLSGS